MHVGQVNGAAAHAVATWHHSVVSQDIDVHAASQPGWTLRYEQLSSGRFEGRFEQIQLPGLCLVRESANQAMRQQGDIGANHYGFAMAFNSPPKAIFNGQQMDAQAIMVGRGDSLDLCTPANFTLIGVVVSAELLQPLWERMYHKPAATWLNRQLVLRASAQVVPVLQALHLKAMRCAAGLDSSNLSSPALMRLRDDVLMEWVEALPPQVDVSELDSLASRKKVVDRACEVMLDAPDEALSMLELCQRVGTSRRKLSYCFQDVLGISPARYLRVTRLNGVRRELKAMRSTSMSVNEVAAKWGFGHLSQFAKDYKHLFGELPSATLQASR